MVTLVDFARVAKLRAELAAEFVAGPEGLLEKGLAERVGDDGYRLTPRGYRLVRDFAAMPLEEAA